MSQQASRYIVINCVKEYNKLFFPVEENKGLLLKRGMCVVGPTIDRVIKAGVCYFCGLLFICPSRL